MAMILASLVLLLATTSCHSSIIIDNPDAALYCLCKDGVAKSSLEKSLDFACEEEADCSPVLRDEACYKNPKQLKIMCDYAVNSYFQITGICDFNGTAMIGHVNPVAEGMSSACVAPGIVRGGGRNYSTALPPHGSSLPRDGYGHGPEIDTRPETGAAALATMKANWSFFIIYSMLLCLFGVYL